MRILFFGINFYPELTGIGKYSGEAAAWLATQGHHVEFITAMPYYPHWEVKEEYRGRLWFTEKHQGVVVHRTPLYVPKDVTTLKRIVHELSFVLSSLVYWVKLFFSRKFDVVIGINPPFQLGIIPWIYGKLRGVKTVYHIQDLQVDVAADLGMIKNKKLLGVLFGIEKFLLNHSTIVSTISEGMVKKVTNKNLIHNNIWLFPNWVDTNFIRPLSKQESLRQQFGYSDDDFIVLYSGTLAEKQGLEQILEVAKELPEIKFMIVGEGGMKQKLLALASSYQLKNVKFYGLQPYEKLPNLLATADIHLVLQKKSASDLVLPSKLTSILSAGGCALVTALEDSTLFNILDKNAAGILAEPESLTALKQSILGAFGQDLSVMKVNARKYAENYLGKEEIMKKFEQQLLSLL